MMPPWCYIFCFCVEILCGVQVYSKGVFPWEGGATNVGFSRGGPNRKNGHSIENEIFLFGSKN